MDDLVLKAPPSQDNVGAYNRCMARGWESKSVEQQQEELGHKSAGRTLSKEEAARFREKENLRLARNQILQQLRGNSNLRHRELLEQTLVELDRKLRE